MSAAEGQVVGEFIVPAASGLQGVVCYVTKVEVGIDKAVAIPVIGIENVV